MDNMQAFNPDGWIKNYSDALYAYTMQRVKDAATAQDIVQDCFLSAWRARETYKGQASEKNWLYSICKNKIIDYYRKQGRNKVDLVDVTEGNYFDDAEHWTNEAAPKNWGIDHNKTLEGKEFNSILGSCKKKLKQLHEMVFNLKYLEDMTSEEICKALDITPSNYWVLLHRAKLQLRACLEKNWLSL